MYIKTKIAIVIIFFCSFAITSFQLFQEKDNMITEAEKSRLEAVI